ncbi:hypothetical protein [Sphingomonas aerolata]|uniref:hypothetical protein n=1 Tax=Sphingomonas aerolata TaxID=185951 RepID=UPI00208F3263|nr:hypothetical protein [Sphingomonas aerolata]USR00117.1 hypothetical protein NEF64_17290 [Sphingomonas aerolata]
MKPEDIMAAIEIERKLVEILSAEAKLGVHSSILNAYHGYVAANARLEALIQILGTQPPRTTE